MGNVIRKYLDGEGWRTVSDDEYADIADLLTPDDITLEAYGSTVRVKPASIGETELESGANLSTRVNAAPADGNIDPSQLFIWFDATNGAAKIMFKGKSANGTVVTGSVSLT